jgi:hypothetical protein
MMSHAPQGDCAGEASGPATNDDKADPMGCLLCRFMTTPLNETNESRNKSRGREERKTYGVRKRAFVHDGGRDGAKEDGT